MPNSVLVDGTHRQKSLVIVVMSDECCEVLVTLTPIPHCVQGLFKEDLHSSVRMAITYNIRLIQRTTNLVKWIDIIEKKNFSRSKFRVSKILERATSKSLDKLKTKQLLAIPNRLHVVPS